MINRFIAKKKDVIIVMSISNQEPITHEKFLKSLKSAIKTYTTYNEKGREVLNLFNGKFDFVDVVNAAKDYAFINIASKYRLFGLKVEILQTTHLDFGLNMNLAE